MTITRDDARLELVAPAGSLVTGLTGQNGDPGWIRTNDLRFRKPVRYPLRYGTICIYVNEGATYR